MSLKRLRLARQRGDTIVEVMAVLAVLGLAISISYETANSSLLDTRQAQESSQAAELVASQVESLRVMASNASTDPNYVFISTPFCITNGDQVQVIASPPPSPNPCSLDSLYNMSITYAANSANPSGTVGGLFTVKATWPDVEGQGNDTDAITYELYHL